MKKRLTRGEKWLFASPLLFLVVAGLLWQRQKNAPETLEIPYVVRLEFSPDSKRLVAFNNDVPRRQYAGQVYDLEAHVKVCDLEMPIISTRGGDYLWSPSWSPDGTRITARSQYYNAPDILSRVSVWDAATGLQKVEQHFPATESSLMSGPISFAPDGKTLVGEGMPSARYDASTGQRLNRPDKTFKDSYVVLKEKLGLFSWSSPDQKLLKIVDVKTGKIIWKIQSHSLRRYGWTGDRLSVADDKQLLIWDGKSRKLLSSPPIPVGARVDAYTLHPKLSTLTYSQYTSEAVPDTEDTFNEKHELIAWDYLDKRELWRTRTTDSLESLGWSPDGKWLAALQNNYKGVNLLLVFDQNGQLRYQNGPVSYLARWSPDSKKLATESVRMDNRDTFVFSRVQIHRFED